MFLILKFVSFSNLGCLTCSLLIVYVWPSETLAARCHSSLWKQAGPQCVLGFAGLVVPNVTSSANKSITYM